MLSERIQTQKPTWCDSVHMTLWKRIQGQRTDEWLSGFGGERKVYEREAAQGKF